MSIVERLRLIRNLSWRPGRPAARSARRLGVEFLEDRTVPTVVFDPNFGPEVIQPLPPGTPYAQTMTQASVDLIFWGTYWGTHGSDVTALQSAAQAILAGPYLSGLTVYGGTGTASYRSSFTDSASDPPAGYSAGDSSSPGNLQGEIVKEINNPSSPTEAPPAGATQTNAPIYVVITDPSHSDTNGGYNKPGLYNSTPINMISIGTSLRGSSVNASFFGETFSHEMVERMTDPTGDGQGVQVAPPAGLPANVTPNDPVDQIADFEPEPAGQSHYYYRLGEPSGPVVQPYWSPYTSTFAGGLEALVVPDGNGQEVHLIPSWTINADGSGTFNGTYALKISGGQFGPSDTVKIGGNFVGGVEVTLNGQVFSFDYGKITSVTYDSNGGSYVQVVSNTVPVTINSEYGSANVTVGGDANDGAAGVQAPVTINNQDGATFLTVDDSTDRRAKTATLADSFVNPGYGAINGLSAEIDYQYAGTFPGGDTDSVTVETGTGGNTIDVSTTGVPTTLVGHSGLTTVNVGSGGSVQGILGTLTVTNPPSFTTLDVDDSADPTSRTVTLGDAAGQPGYGSITGLAPAQIDYRYGDTQSVTVRTGAGGAAVGVLATGVSTTLVGGAGGTTVNVGNAGSVQGILGTLTVTNPSSFANIDVDDSADPASQTVTLGTYSSDGASYGSVTGLAPAEIDYKCAETASVTVRTGTGVNTVNVLATGVPTNVVGYAARTVNVGNAGSVQGILAPLTLTNPPSFDTVTVDDSADTTGQIATLGTYTDSAGSVYGTVAGLSLGTIYYKLADTASPVTIDAGSGGNTFTVTGPNYRTIDLNLGTGGDAVNLQAAGAALNVAGTGGADTVAFAAGASTTGTIDGGPGSVTLDYSAYGAATLNLATGAATATGGVAHVGRFVGGPGGTLVGPDTANTWHVTGAGAGDVNGSVTFAGVANLTGGAGADTFKFGPAGRVAGVVTGGGGTDTLDYSARTTGVAIDLQAGTATATGGVSGIENVIGTAFNDAITAAAGGSVIYAGGGRDTLTGGPGDDTFVLTAPTAANTVITGRGGNDTVVGPDAATTWAITGANAGTVGGATFTGVENLTGGAGNDTFKFGPAGRVSGRIDGGGGTDRLNYSGRATPVTVNLQTGAATGTGGFARIDGLTGGPATTLVGPNAPTMWNLTGANAGTVNDTFLYAGVPNLTGGAGADVFAFAAGGSESGRIVGGGGADWLDYTARTTPIVVDLAAGAATGVNRGRAGGVAGVHNVRGSATAANTLIGDAAGGVLIGGAAADRITGGSGRSILIGGAGADRVVGGRGGDILIGGSTAYDASTPANNAALLAILAEWRSADPYVNRIAKIESGTLAGGAELVYGSTVTDDGAADRLTGGPGRDWFFADRPFADRPQDTITDLNVGGPEQVN